MARLNQNTVHVLLQLKREYEELSWLKRMFFPEALRVALEAFPLTNQSIRDAWPIYSAFFNNAWFFQLWLFPSFTTFLGAPATKVCHMLLESGLLSFGPVFENFNAVMMHKDPRKLIYPLRILQANGFLTNVAGQINFDVVVSHTDPKGLASVLHQLDALGLLTTPNFDIVKDHPSPRNFAHALKRLETLRAPIQYLIPMMARYQNPLDFFETYQTLLYSGLIRENHYENLNAIARLADPMSLTVVLEIFRSGFCMVRITQDNFNALIRQPHLSYFSYALQKFSRSRFTHQVEFDALITYSDIFFGASDTANIWSQIPYQQLDTSRFNSMVEIAQAHITDPAAGRTALIAYVTHEFGSAHDIHTEAAASIAVSDTLPSLPTSNTHQALPESTQKLLSRYNPYDAKISGRKLDETIYTLADWLQTRQVSYEVKIARRCLQQLIRGTSHDRVSQALIKRLLALAWHAIHDKANRKGNLKDAKDQFIQALCEIQHEYSFVAVSADTGGEDNGSTNKKILHLLTEKLQRLLPDELPRNTLSNSQIAAVVSSAGVALAEHGMFAARISPDPAAAASAEEYVVVDIPPPTDEHTTLQVGMG